MRDAGEAIMNIFAINEALKAPRIGSLAIISGAMLSVVGVVGPALSADLPDDYPPYRPPYYRNSYSGGDYGNSYNSGCYRCGCCGLRITPAAQRFVEEREPVVVERPVVERFPVAERHWVQRDYLKRLSFYYETRYPHPSPYPYPSRYRYPPYYPSRSADADRAYDAASLAEPRRFGYGGAEYPPAAAAYEYAAEPRTPYRHVTSRPYDYRPEYEYRPSYEYETSPRPPVAVPSGYYGRGYSE
jgi:hypothetical protein